MNRSQSLPLLTMQILSISAIILAFIGACGAPTLPVLPTPQIAYVYPQTPTLDELGSPPPTNVEEVTGVATPKETIPSYTVTPTATTPSPTPTLSPSPTLTPSVSATPKVVTQPSDTAQPVTVVSNETGTVTPPPVSTTCTPTATGTPTFTPAPTPTPTGTPTFTPAPTPTPIGFFWIEPVISKATCSSKGEARVQISLKPHGGGVPYAFYPSRNFYFTYPAGLSASVYVAAQSGDGQQWAAIIELPIIECRVLGAREPATRRVPLQSEVKWDWQDSLGTDSPGAVEL